MTKQKGFVPNYGDVATLEKYFDDCHSAGARIGGPLLQCMGIWIEEGWSDQDSFTLTITRATVDDDKLPLKAGSR